MQINKELYFVLLYEHKRTYFALKMHFFEKVAMGVAVAIAIAEEFVFATLLFHF